MRRALAAALLLVAGCLSSQAAGPRLVGDGRRVLFIGNSYLASQDIPGIVQALADSAAGDRLAVETVAGPNMALVDHWNEGTARSEIAKGGWEWVVLQQGPSSRAENRDSLRLLTRTFAAELAKVGAKPALFSAWPAEANRADFPRAVESYQLASSDVSGVFLPVATAWLEAWDRQPGTVLYVDGLHASAEGAYLSALVVYATLLKKSPIGLPSSLRTRAGRLLAIDPALASMLQAAAAEVLVP
jgi:hypothetical protein